MAASLGQVPCVLVGDFNQDPLPPLAEAQLQVSGWRDLAEALGPTTCPGGGRRGRRVDRVYANSVAAQAVSAVRLRWDLGVSTHAGVEVSFRTGPSRPYMARLRPKQLHGPPRQDWSEEGAGRIMAARWRWQAASGAFQGHLHTGDVTAAWTMLSAMAAGYLADRLGVREELVHRGSPAAAVRREVSAPIASDLGAATATSHRWEALVRLVEKALRLWPAGQAAPPPAQAHRALAAARAVAVGLGEQQACGRILSACTYRETLQELAAELRASQDAALKGHTGGEARGVAQVRGE